MSVNEGPHPGVYVANKGCIVHTYTIVNMHQVGLCHWWVSSVGIEADSFANRGSKEPKVPHLVQGHIS